MPGRRSLTGIGRISLIYTLGIEETPNGAQEPVMTGSVGEDFAECTWPVVVKCQAQVQRTELIEHLSRLKTAIKDGFWMNPGSAPTLYWRWTGDVPPGMHPEGPSMFGTVDSSQALGTGRRSVAGGGTECGLYLFDKADRWMRPEFYGRYHGQTAVSASVGEDFAVTSWPIVVKVHPDVSRQECLQYLTDGEAAIRQGFFVDVTRAVA